MAKETLRDLYTVVYPNAKRTYGDMAAGLTRQAMMELIRKSQVDPTTIAPDSGPLRLTYTVTVTVDRLAGVDYQTIEVTVAETGISE